MRRGGGSGDAAARPRSALILARPTWPTEIPGAEALPVIDIMRKAGLDDSSAPEIQDIVDRLESLGVIEMCEGTRG